MGWRGGVLLVIGMAAIAGCDPGHLEGWSKGRAGDLPGSSAPPRLIDAGHGGGPPAGNLGDAGELTPPPPPAPDLPDAGAPADPSDPCMGLDYLGMCAGETARWCENGMLRQRDCAAMGQHCQWVDATTGYYCGTGTGGTMPPPPGGGDPGGGTTSPSGCASDFEQQNLDLVNAARRDAGLSPLTCDPGLAMAARLHSQDMCDHDYFSHESRDGRSFTDRIDAQHVTYGSAGENIAWGQTTPREVHETWMDSPGHRANILGGDYRRIGIGYVACSGSPYWTQDFTD